MLSENEGLVLDIQKLSTEDGPGIRTTVFLKGCNLNCAWCHNPESIPPRGQCVWTGARCMGCRCCESACRHHALSFTEDSVTIDRAACTACMVCVQACPTGALEQKGTPFTPEALANELLKDRAYYEKSGGGVTISGGEPLIQADFVCAVFRALKEQNVHTALDTAGCVPFATLEKALEYCDLLLFDLKLIDDSEHRQYTGVGNDRILANARRAADFMAKRGRGIWVRTPVIPGATDSAQNIAGIGRFIAQNMEHAVERWELCAFNNLCRDKYERLGLNWRYEKTGLMKRADMEALCAAARGCLREPGKAAWSGAAAES